MRLRNTILTGAASYVQMGSLVLTQLVAIPLALRFLDNERFGLWSFTSQSLGYLFLLDFGVTNSIGRLLAEPIHTGEQRAWNGWFNMVLAVLLIQAAAILSIGLFLADPILRWFEIQEALLVEARQLWLMMLILNALMFPLRLFSGILVAQNRSYWVFLSSAMGALCGLAAFYLFLKLGWGSLAYGFSAMTQMFFSLGPPLLAVMRGPNRFRISFRDIPWHKTRELFGFSSSVFVTAVAAQIVFASQSLIITKILGLGAVASFTVCSRVPTLFMQFTWRFFDALGPRWAIYWDKGQMPQLTGEFRRSFRFAVGLTLLVMTCSFALNRWFVFVFGKEQLYIGKEFDFFFAIFVIFQSWSRFLLFCFVLAKRLKIYAMIICLDTALSLVMAVTGTKLFGLTGYIGFAAAYGVIGLAFWYTTLRGPRILSLSLSKLLSESATPLLLFSGLLGAGLIAFQYVSDNMHMLVAETAISFVALSLFAAIYRDELLTMFRRVQNIRQSWLSAKSAAPPAG